MTNPTSTALAATGPCREGCVADRAGGVAEHELHWTSAELRADR